MLQFSIEIDKMFLAYLLDTYMLVRYQCLQPALISAAIAYLVCFSKAN